MQVIASPEVNDVVVIGSGAGGGTVVRELTRRGVRVTLLEAGPMLDPARDFKEHMAPWEVDHRGAGRGAAAYFEPHHWSYWSAPHGFWDDPAEPYTTAPGQEFWWMRSRVLGGRTNHWGRISLRYSDYDFKPSLTDGLGDDWPISYEDLAPYYDKAEAFIGVTGSREGLRSAPDGNFLPCPEPRAHEVLIQRAARELGIPCIANRRAVLTRPLNGRPACHYCGQCGRGCITAATYSSSQVQILPALETGRLDIVPNAMAREILSDAEGRVTGVSYIDKTTRTEKTLRARVVVVAASACETTRLLLNSKSPRYPRGLCNDSGVLGRYLTDNVGFSLYGIVPALEGMPHYNTDGYGGAHLYMPWWELDKKNKDFPRGYHVELWGGYGMPGLGSFQRVVREHGGWGADLKEAIRRDYGTVVAFSGRGDMVPNHQSYCEIDPDGTLDEWGIPVLRFHFQWSDYEWKMARHMERTFTDLIEAMGGRVGGIASPDREGKGISVPGSIIHELGTARMGSDPRSSVVNEFCQGHTAPNLFLADAAPFLSNPDKNPTLTIIALAWRTADRIAELMESGDV